MDLSRVLAGPLCGMLLGDLGADVIKVERPGHGDETRGWGPPFDGDGESAYYLSINRNKLGITADLAAPRDRDLVLELIAGADVVLDNFLPGVLDRYGYDVAASLARHPRLVWCTITGFGEVSDRPGYDFVVQAECGWMAVTGTPDGEPMKVGMALADVIAGKDAAAAILAALVGRDRGASRRAVVSLAESARAALINVAQNTLVSGTEARRWGNAHANLVPYQAFHAADRHVVIAVGSDAQWLACAKALHLDELANDAALRSNAGRLRDRDRIVSAIARAVGQEPATSIVERLRAARVPAGVVNSVLDAVKDAGSASPTTGMPPVAGGIVRRPPPRLGQHGPLVRSRGWDAFREA